MKRTKDADELVTMVHHLLSGGEKLVQQDRLRSLLHRLEAETKGGLASRRRVTELVTEISKIVCEELLRRMRQFLGE